MEPTLSTRTRLNNTFRSVFELPGPRTHHGEDHARARPDVGARSVGAESLPVPVRLPPEGPPVRRGTDL